jgi:ribosome-associated protein
VTKEGKISKGTVSTKKTVNRSPGNSRGAIQSVIDIAEERKADYIKILNVGPRLIITDYFVIISARNPRLARRISEEISTNLKKSGLIPLNIDGINEGNWILMDYDDFVVHIFTDQYKDYYDLERLWRDSKVVKIKENSDAIEKKNRTDKNIPEEKNP